MTTLDDAARNGAAPTDTTLDGAMLDDLADTLSQLLPHVVSPAADHFGSGWTPPGSRRDPGAYPPDVDATLAAWATPLFREHDADVDAARGLLLRDLLATNPAVSDAAQRVRDDGGSSAQRALRNAVAEALRAADGTDAGVLLALLASPAPPGHLSGPDGRGRETGAADDVGRRPGPVARIRAMARRFVRRKRADGLLARSTAAFWMTLLIALPIVAAYLTVWGGWSSSPTPVDVSIGLLKVLVVWCLAFLPGWLYVRFLGRRAGALWNEYVLHLHRLGLDDPGHLPRPPRNSTFFGEWLHGRGYLQPQELNLYRQKFDAYYGRPVSHGGATGNFAVRTETMFPVFLTALVLSTCWVVVLYDPTFVTAPSSGWDMLKYAFLGAYGFIAQSLIRRFFQTDLRPSAYASALLRIVVVIITMTAIHQLVRGAIAPTTEAVVAFIVGFFPSVALEALRRAAGSVLRVVVPQLTPAYPLSQLDGLNVWYEARLVEEGIEDMQNLVTANVVEVMLHTRVPVGRLMDWIDQAVLYLHIDRTEVGFTERRLVRARHAPTTEEATASATTHPAVAAPAQALPPPSPTSGSVVPQNRAGTRTRLELRQVGVRTATDLLKTFPPAQIDPTRGGAGGQARDFLDLLPAHVDNDQIRTLVRTIDEDTALAPVWNWQARGVRAHERHRRPRSSQAA